MCIRDRLDIPQADAIFYPYVLADSGAPIAMKFEYDSDLRLSLIHI